MRQFDFNAIKQPTLAVTLKGGAVINLELPTAGHVELLQREIPHLRERIDKHGLSGIHRYYAILAELMSCNAENLTFTADDLEKEYRITLSDMIEFYTVYLQFIDEAKSAKN